jgi:serine/threonine-protein kinase RsbW
VPATAHRGRSREKTSAETPPALTLRFRGLAGAVDELHASFDAWEQDGSLAGSLDHFGRQVLRLAAHEWLANLVQHAAFGRRRPDISLGLTLREDGVHCAIEDNSTGFDFHRQLATQEQIVGGAQPSERGRGLLMLIACTDDLAYTPEDGRQRLSFRVRTGSPRRGRLGSLFQVPRGL